MTLLNEILQKPFMPCSSSWPTIIRFPDMWQTLDQQPLHVEFFKREETLGTAAEGGCQVTLESSF